MTISGIGSGLTVTGVGTIRWLIADENGKELELLIDNSIYVPQCLMNLCSPQQLARQTGDKGDCFNALAEHGILQIIGKKRTVSYDIRS